MKLFRAPWKRLPDEEFIEQLRRSMKLWDRGRFWLFLLFVVLLVILSWLLSQYIPLMLKLAGPANAPGAVMGFVVGTVAGSSFAWMFYSVLHGLTSALSGFRAERMLLEYVDAHGLEPEQQQDQEAEPDEFRDPVRGPQGHPSDER